METCSLYRRLNVITPTQASSAGYNLFRVCPHLSNFLTHTNHTEQSSRLDVCLCANGVCVCAQRIDCTHHFVILKAFHYTYWYHTLFKQTILSWLVVCTQRQTQWQFNNHLQQQQQKHIFGQMNHTKREVNVCHKMELSESVSFDSTTSVFKTRTFLYACSLPLFRLSVSLLLFLLLLAMEAYQ